MRLGSWLIAAAVAASTTAPAHADVLYVYNSTISPFSFSYQSPDFLNLGIGEFLDLSTGSPSLSGDADSVVFRTNSYPALTIEASQGGNPGKYAAFAYEAVSAFGSYASFDGGNDIATLTVSHIAAVPEPATWAMMLAGFAFVGGVMRRRRITSYSPAITAPA